MELEERLKTQVQTLSDGLRESLQIVMDRENDFSVLDKERLQLIEMNGKLEQRIASLQNANFLKCPNCKNLRNYVEYFKDKFQEFSCDRREMTMEISDIKQQHIENAISEKDALIARIEMSGAKTQDQIENLDQLRSVRMKLNESLKIECENSISRMVNCTNLERTVEEAIEKFEGELLQFSNQLTLDKR